LRRELLSDFEVADQRVENIADSDTLRMRTREFSRSNQVGTNLTLPLLQLPTRLDWFGLFRAFILLCDRESLRRSAAASPGRHQNEVAGVRNDRELTGLESNVISPDDGGRMTSWNFPRIAP
jgi:hypothetical protein